MNPKLFRFLFSRYVSRMVRKCWLDDHFNASELETILQQTWTDYLAEADKIPKQANLGNALMMHFAALTLSAYRILHRQGIPKEEAIEMVSRVTKHITYTWTKRGKVLLTPFFPNKLNRLYAGMQFIMHTLFSRPGYQFTVERFVDGFREDVTQCPVAVYMKEKGIPELCVRAWCGVDPGVVAIMDGKLTRTGTLAMGRDYCDFVFHLAEED
ncbi:MAG: L-2-amino-thiazoline-4-carboxylic acid hydrolase [Anaerolineae bacterium]|jgi:hypothetical protein|nr:L-2-amino-thiazoline-4-carboxylic acid hydrolase [Anaerolineae bacterium]